MQKNKHKQDYFLSNNLSFSFFFDETLMLNIVFVVDGIIKERFDRREYQLERVPNGVRRSWTDPDPSSGTDSRVKKR